MTETFALALSTAAGFLGGSAIVYAASRAHMQYAFVRELIEHARRMTELVYDFADRIQCWSPDSYASMRCARAGGCCACGPMQEPDGSMDGVRPPDDPPPSACNQTPGSAHSTLGPLEPAELIERIERDLARAYPHLAGVEAA